MTTTLRSFLISAALSLPVFAQTPAPHYNSFLDEVFFPKLKTDAQVAELVKKAGFQPSLNPVFQFNQFQAALPGCTLGAWVTLSDDGGDLMFATKLRELTDSEALRRDDLLGRLEKTTPAQRFDMFFRVAQIGNGKPVLLLYVMLPNRGATPSEVKAVVSQLADVGVATVKGGR
jgi:hypothetical protein